MPLLRRNLSRNGSSDRPINTQDTNINPRKRRRDDVSFVLSHENQVCNQVEKDSLELKSKRRRSRAGCLNCRRRKKKCDERKPICSRCCSRYDKCEWDEEFKFRYSGLKNDQFLTDQQQQCRRTSRSCSDSLKSQTNAHICRKTWSPHSRQENSMPLLEDQLWIPQDAEALDLQGGSVTGEQARTGNVNSAQLLFRRNFRSRGANGLGNGNNGSEGSSVHPQITGENHISARDSDPCQEFHVENLNTDKHNLSSCVPSIDEQSAPTIDHTPGPFSPDSNTQGGSLTDPEFGHVELGPLDYLTSSKTVLDAHCEAPTHNFYATRDWRESKYSSATDSSGSELSPGSSNLPLNQNQIAAYKSLHRTLHHHIVETARCTALTRQGTPDGAHISSSTYGNDEQPGRFFDTVSGSSTPACLTRQRELLLWQNYLDEIAQWLDMFDEERHFQNKIPTMAKSAEHLRYSILALSARQRERRDVDDSSTESLALYQTAIELIVPQLAFLDISVIASCVLLCVFDMMSSSTRAWAQHLDGCALLLEAAEINGVVGGIKQALFWCFARMDVWGGFLSDTFTKIPTNRWFVPTGSMSAAVRRLRNASGTFGSYANYAVFLCACTVNVISSRDVANLIGIDVAGDPQTPYPTRWTALYQLLEDWYANRPQEMQPLMVYPLSENHQHNPFPTVLYGTPPAVNGNQLYHTSCLLMLQAKPNGVSLARTTKSILWHARQICGIAASNFNHGSWINALQPLWVAGQKFSHPTEHKAILEILSRIENETGWATSWRADDLKVYWGSAD